MILERLILVSLHNLHMFHVFHLHFFFFHFHYRGFNVIFIDLLISELAATSLMINKNAPLARYSSFRGTMFIVWRYLYQHNFLLVCTFSSRPYARFTYYHYIREYRRILYSNMVDSSLSRRCSDNGQTCFYSKS